MSPFELIFAIANPVALLGWIGLALFPGRRTVVDGISGVAIPALFALAYAGLVAAFFAGADGGFSSIEAVRALFRSDALLVAGWLHYLAFDLFVGAWEVRTARAEGIPHLLVVPCLVLTFLFGPLGFLAFLILRAAYARGASFAMET
ncbi:MAG TPA: ABA4-like family protein [Bauldia sp.]|nr:ABA4-like family protein [Bauldia sp.]